VNSTHTHEQGGRKLELIESESLLFNCDAAFLFNLFINYCER